MLHSISLEYFDKYVFRHVDWELAVGVDFESTVGQSIQAALLSFHAFHQKTRVLDFPSYKNQD